MGDLPTATEAAELVRGSYSDSVRAEGVIVEEIWPELVLVIAPNPDTVHQAEFKATARCVNGPGIVRIGWADMLKVDTTDASEGFRIRVGVKEGVERVDEACNCGVLTQVWNPSCAVIVEIATLEFDSHPSHNRRQVVRFPISPDGDAVDAAIPIGIEVGIASANDDV